MVFVLAFAISPGTPDERAAAILEFQAAAADARRVALRGAHAVLNVLRTGAHHDAGAASIAHFGELNGVPAAVAREWANLSLAIATRPSTDDGSSGGGSASGDSGLGSLEGSLGPTLEVEVAAGTVPVASAAILGEIVAVQRDLPAGSQPFVRIDDEWLHWARTRSTKDLRRLYLQRRDEVSAAEVVTPVTVYVPERVREDFARARVLVSRSAQRLHTLGETLAIVVAQWLADHDPMQQSPGTRRLPDTSTIPGRRYVPAEVDRHVRARSNDRCIVPYCDADLWVHRSHRVAHRDGGSREAHQLDLLCGRHHALYEAGRIKITGPADAPIVTDAWGRPLDRRSTWPVMSGDPPRTEGPTANHPKSSSAEPPVDPGRAPNPPGDRPHDGPAESAPRPPPGDR